MSFVRNALLAGALALGASIAVSAQTPSVWEKDDRTWSNDGVSLTVDEAFRAHPDAKRKTMLDVATPDHHFESAFLLVDNEATALALLHKVHKEALSAGTRPWPLKWLPADRKWHFKGEKFAVRGGRQRFERGVGYLSDGTHTLAFLFEMHALKPADRIETTLYAVLEGIKLPGTP